MSDLVRIVNESEYHAPAPELPAALSPALPAAPPLPAATLPGAGVRIRPGVLGDYPFIDALQKANKHGVGFMWEKAIKGHLEKGNVLVAEQGVGCREEGVGQGSAGPSASGSTPYNLDPTPSPAQPVGYVLGTDRYLKRDELGVIYQMCVAPGYRRSLVAANLLKAKFESSAYGCRLYCCWCAQDLEANRFWEAMGFVPLAFRTGGRGRGAKGSRGRGAARMHIFWQKRIREGDTGDPATGGTPYWFPSMTGAGAIAEDRIVLPIPPGTHWSDAKPVVLPEGPRKQGEGEDEVKRLEDAVSRLEREKKKGLRGQGPGGRVQKAKLKRAPGVRRAMAGGLHFGPVPGPPEVSTGEASTAAVAAERAAVEAELKEAKRALRREKKKFDPAQVAFARELKDRWLEQVQREPGLLAPGREKYGVCRRIAPGSTPGPGIESTSATQLPAVRRLDAA